MSQVTLILNTDLPGLPIFGRGKVRDTYDLGDSLLMVTTDRISAFDVVLPNAIPHKGAVLTQLSAFWFDRTKHIIPNHLISASLADFPDRLQPHANQLDARAMLVRKARRVDVECVVRGYMAGSAWAEYCRMGTVCGERLPAGIRESANLPAPIFTPATKEASGHDINISQDQLKDIVGRELADKLASTSLALYRFADQLARERGIIIADTKFEFGFIDGELSLIDEVLTPDSSRFWSMETYRVGEAQPSFDKQYVRDWLVSVGWNKEPPAPLLPDDVVAKTSEKYLEAYRRITGRSLV
ncbi:MAG: phosphoribosylaminoimidazolesuccinocarboxamide synthase [Actinobacteria bacterium]|nr:phosphoribosylaminoimidazolesuccinocarboxamide synthase [Actinomycetota bacterium]